MLDREKKLYWFFLLFIVIISFIAKFVILNKYVTPPSPDYGNYLSQVSILRGHDVTGVGLRYNPLFFVLLDVFLRFFDTFAALKIAAALVFSFAAFPFFFLAKRLCGNSAVALVCTWLFIFFEGYSEMIAWGGNPNFLAFSFMLFSLYFFLSSLKNPSKKNLLLTGLALSLVIGTHFLVAAFVLLWFAFFLTLNLVLKKDVRRIFKISLLSGLSAIVLSLPYTSVYLTFFTQSSATLVAPSITQLTESASSLEWLFRGSVIIMTLLAILGVVALSKYLKDHVHNGLALVSLFLTPFAFILTTEQPGRWFYFLPIPIVLSFSLFLRNLSASKINWRNARRIFVLCFILSISIATTIFSLTRLQVAAEYYQSIGADEIQALIWIKNNTPSSAVFATSGPNKVIGGDLMPGSSYSWWIEGFSERRCIATGFTKWFTFKDEQSEVEIANRIFAGAYTFEVGDVGVSESFPDANANPEIGTIVYGQYQNVISINDAEQELVLSSKDNENIILQTSLFYSNTKTFSIQRSTTEVNATFVYEGENFEVIRNVIINKERSAVDLVYTISPTNLTLKQFKVNLWSSYFTSLLNYEINNSTVTLYQQTATRAVETNIALLHTNAELENTTVMYKDPKYSIPVATFSLKPLQDKLYANIRITIVSNDHQTQPQGVSTNNATHLIKESGIEYILLSKARTKECQRFTNSQNFSVVFENKGVVIFKSKQEVAT